MKARKNRVSSSQVNLLNYLFFLFSLFLTDSLFCRSEKKYECVYINSTSNSGFIPFIFISSQFLIVLDKHGEMSGFFPTFYLVYSFLLESRTISSSSSHLIRI